MKLNSFKIRKAKEKHKATIEFDLSDEESNIAFKRAVKSLDMARFIFDITQLGFRISKESESFDNLRSGGVSITAKDMIERFQQEIGILIEKYNLDIDDLIN